MKDSVSGGPTGNGMVDDNEFGRTERGRSCICMRGRDCGVDVVKPLGAATSLKVPRKRPSAPLTCRTLTLEGEFIHEVDSMSTSKIRLCLEKFERAEATTVSKVALQSSLLMRMEVRGHPSVQTCSRRYGKKSFRNFTLLLWDVMELTGRLDRW